MLFGKPHSLRQEINMLNNVPIGQLLFETSCNNTHVNIGKTRRNGKMCSVIPLFIVFSWLTPLKEHPATQFNGTSSHDAVDAMS